MLQRGECVYCSETDEYWIQDTKDGQYDILLIYLGQWDEMFKGRRNADELEAFRGEVRTLITKVEKFPGPVVWLLEPDEGKNPQRAVIQKEVELVGQFIIHYQRPLIEAGRSAGARMGHGYGGVVSETFARTLLTTLCVMQ